MTIHFSPERWARVQTDARAWWAGALPRPLIQATVWGQPADRPEPELPAQGFHSFYDLTVPAEAIVDRWDYDLSTVKFLGDSFPSLWPNFGPGVAAAFLGASLQNGEQTVWFHPRTEVELADLHTAFDPDNRWLRRVADLTRVAVERWHGLVQVGMTDIGGNLDMLASFRPGEKLLFDLYDDPESVKSLTWEFHDRWWEFFRYFEAIQRAGLPGGNPGYTAWTSIFSEAPYYMLQCDFCYMIGPEMFDEFVKPELVASCRKLTNAFYHLDGPGQLPHLDSLLTIPELKGVQWVPGDGQPDVSEWPEVYRKIRDAGKLIQVFAGQYAGGFAILDVLADQLGSAEGIVVIGGVAPQEEEGVAALIHKYGAG
jgi:hypothetical protein